MTDRNTTDAPSRWDGVDLNALLNVDAVGASSFQSRYSEDNGNKRAFGGQLLGQALMSAAATVPDGMTPSALHVLFLQGAQTDQPITYQGESLQDGRHFASRRVAGRQGERRVIDAHATFNVDMQGFAHALPAHQGAPGPERVLPMSDLFRDATGSMEGHGWRPIDKPCLELRIVNAREHLFSTSATPHMAFWMRLKAPLAEDPMLHWAALAYLSDYWINSAAITYHVPARDAHSTLYIASLNHSIWFHRSSRADDWLLLSCESPSAQQGRALTTARVYNRNGALVASVAQECLMVRRD